MLKITMKIRLFWSILELAEGDAWVLEIHHEIVKFTTKNCWFPNNENHEFFILLNLALK